MDNKDIKNKVTPVKEPQKPFVPSGWELRKVKANFDAFRHFNCLRIADYDPQEVKPGGWLVIPKADSNLKHLRTSLLDILEK